MTSKLHNGSTKLHGLQQSCGKMDLAGDQALSCSDHEDIHVQTDCKKTEAQPSIASSPSQKLLIVDRLADAYFKECQLREQTLYSSIIKKNNIFEKEMGMRRRSVTPRWPSILEDINEINENLNAIQGPRESKNFSRKKVGSKRRLKIVNKNNKAAKRHINPKQPVEYSSAMP
ncbi:uncharacterized protein LOC115629675 [Scaptodrosophila lebanonensis]|uniref:Uncharacterized protein LOC115629675 n=1 Tax=Drosophila lebanonensis TaxID=7225 RepID=A0A6J2U4J3_DROLE|nr:uncharacterized protein LOC115629675 [Scaptodrosophila lebanonensis]